MWRGHPRCAGSINNRHLRQHSRYIAANGSKTAEKYVKYEAILLLAQVLIKGLFPLC
jgi:hypothetical protein